MTQPTKSTTPAARSNSQSTRRQTHGKYGTRPAVQPTKTPKRGRTPPEPPRASLPRSKRRLSVSPATAQNPGPRRRRAAAMASHVGSPGRGRTMRGTSTIGPCPAPGLRGSRCQAGIWGTRTRASWMMGRVIEAKQSICEPLVNFMSSSGRRFSWCSRSELGRIRSKVFGASFTCCRHISPRETKST